jgi:hypothetical protein
VYGRLGDGPLWLELPDHQCPLSQVVWGPLLYDLGIKQHSLQLV